MSNDVPEAKLLLVQPNQTPTRLALKVPTITVGRAQDCTIPIRDRFLSRHHAEIALLGEQWVVRDCGSANGTQLNGKRIDKEIPLRPGDRITLGDSELIFQSDEDSKSQLIALDTPAQATSLSMSLQKAVDDDFALSREPERARMLNDLALELIEDRSMEMLFDFILDRVMQLLRPSRAALALLGPDKKSFLTVRVRRHDSKDSTDLAISRTLLGEVVDEKRVVSYYDSDSNVDQQLLRAESLIGQSIRSALLAPLLVRDDVLGVLYIDYRFEHGPISPEDLRLLARVARFAGVKLETTRLREEALAKAVMDEELRTAYTIQKRLLPAAPPAVQGYSFSGKNRPCRTVSGDYFDFVIRPDGRLYFIIADVSGKGITAALVMSALATAFNIFTRTDPAPGDLLREMNETLAPKTAPTKFATVWVGVLDPASGKIDYANGGHVPPLLIKSNGVVKLDSTDLVIGLFPTATYRTQTVTLEKGDGLVLFTDGITEAADEQENELGFPPVIDALAPQHGYRADQLVETIEETVEKFVCGAPMMDDFTVAAVTRQ